MNSNELSVDLWDKTVVSSPCGENAGVNQCEIWDFYKVDVVILAAYPHFRMLFLGFSRKYFLQIQK